MSTQTASHELATLPPVQRRLLWTLGLGAFGLAFSITTISVALPPLLHTFTDSGSLIGLAIGAEGLFALTLSPVVGPWSDSFHTPLGRRRPFMLVGLGPMAFCLLLIPFMPTLWTTVLLVLAIDFVLLYGVDGLHESKTVAGEILAAVAAGYVVAAVFAGRLGDRFGLARVIFFASFVYGTGFIIAGLAQHWRSWYLGLIAMVSIAGGTVMTLAWGLLYKIVPVQHRGAVSGLATTTKGIGLLLGAPLAG